jgi:hypothetical protein
MNPLLLGTLCFVLLGAAVFVGTAAYLRKVSDPARLNMNTRIAGVSVALGAVCMWLMWICTYMHQMHPLIKPILPK